MRFDRITIEPGKLGGKPCIRGLRISVNMLVGMMQAGTTDAELLENYPFLEPEDLQQAREYYEVHREEIEARNRAEEEMIERLIESGRVVQIVLPPENRPPQ